MPPAISVWTRDERVGGVDVPSDAATVSVSVPLPDREPEQPVIVHFPEAPAVTVRAVRGIGGSIAPAARGPRWLAYGDSITQGWSVTDPGRSWAATVARRAGLDLVNLGFAGSARGELPAALQIKATAPVDVLTMAWGTNCWSSIPTDADLLREQVRAFLSVVRQGHPDVPLVVLSPILRPAAEHEPNILGATLAGLRGALEESVLTFRDRCQDDRLHLVPGGDIVASDELVDGVHPGDTGHEAMARAVLAAFDRLGVATGVGRSL